MCIFWNIYIFIYIQLNSLQQIHHFAPCFVKTSNRLTLDRGWVPPAAWWVFPGMQLSGLQWLIGQRPHTASNGGFTTFLVKGHFPKKLAISKGTMIKPNAFQLRHVLSRSYIEWFGTRKWLVTRWCQLIFVLLSFSFHSDPPRTHHKPSSTMCIPPIWDLKWFCFPSKTRVKHVFRCPLHRVVCMTSSEVTAHHPKTSK